MTEYPLVKPTSSILARELHETDREALKQHFLSLPDNDRALRFGQSVSDEVVSRYVDHLNFNRDTIFGVTDEHLRLVGVAHLAYLDETGAGVLAEFGVSTLPDWRGKGVGTALFQRCAIHCRNTRVTTLFVHCLSRNTAMMHIARKAGMEVHYDGSEADAYLKLPPADPFSFLNEAVQEQAAEMDYTLKRQNEHMRRMAEGWWDSFAPTGSSSASSATNASPAVAT